MSKTWKAAKKRIKITKHKLLKRKAGQDHLNTKERGKTVSGKRRLVESPLLRKALK